MCLAFFRASRAYVPSGLCFVPAFIFLRALRAFSYLRALCALIFYVLYMPLFFYVFYVPSFFTCLDFFSCLLCPLIFTCLHILRAYILFMHMLIKLTQINELIDHCPSLL